MEPFAHSRFDPQKILRGAGYGKQCLSVTAVFATVSKVVMAFYDKAIDSDVIGPYFENVDMPALMDHQTKFISQVMGGPASYTDDVLKRVHAPLKIDAAAFDEMIEILEDTLDDFDVEEDDIQIILNELKVRRGHVVTA